MLDLYIIKRRSKWDITRLIWLPWKKSHDLSSVSKPERVLRSKPSNWKRGWESLRKNPEMPQQMYLVVFLPVLFPNRPSVIHQSNCQLEKREYSDSSRGIGLRVWADTKVPKHYHGFFLKWGESEGPVIKCSAGPKSISPQSNRFADPPCGLLPWPQDHNPCLITRHNQDGFS